MQALAALCVRRPVFASVLILSLVVVGTFSLTRLGVDLMPNIDIPTITVTTRLPGAAPEQVESEITDKVEEAVNTISGIDQLNSNSAEGISQVVVDLPAGEGRRHRGAGSARSRQPHPAAAAAHHHAADHREAGPRRAAHLHAGADGRQAHPRRHRVRRQGAAAAARERRRRRAGAGARRPQPADQRRAGRRAAARLQPDGQRRRRARCSRRTWTCRAGRWSAARSRSRCAPAAASSTRTSSATSWSATWRGHPVRVARRGAGRRRHGRGAHHGQRERRADGAAADPQAVGHQHGGGGPEHQEPPGGSAGRPARGLLGARRPRSVRVHPGVGVEPAGAPDPRVAAGVAGGADLPRQLPLHGDRGHLDPHLDHRHLRAGPLHGLHAEHADHAGADAVGRAS